ASAVLRAGSGPGWSVMRRLPWVLSRAFAGGRKIYTGGIWAPTSGLPLAALKPAHERESENGTDVRLVVLCGAYRSRRALWPAGASVTLRRPPLYAHLASSEAVRAEGRDRFAFLRAIRRAMKTTI